MQNLLNQLLHKWRYENIAFENGESIDQIVRLEKEIGYLFPLEFKDYLKTVNGMCEGESDKDLFYFWSSKLIISEVREFKPAGPDSIFIGFADRIVIDSVYMIEVFKSSKMTGRVAIKKKNLQIIAPNFQTFLSGYLNNLGKQLSRWEKASDNEGIVSQFSLFFENLIPSQLATAT